MVQQQLHVSQSAATAEPLHVDSGAVSMMDDRCSERQGSDPVDSHELPPLRPPPTRPEARTGKGGGWQPYGPSNGPQQDTQTYGQGPTERGWNTRRATVQLRLEHAERPETPPFPEGPEEGKKYCPHWGGMGKPSLNGFEGSQREIKTTPYTLDQIPLGDKVLLKVARLWNRNRTLETYTLHSSLLPPAADSLMGRQKTSKGLRHRTLM
ncbi:unnamed protein product [Boreogadus saida]